jgi:hypothetical protein
MMKGRDVRLEDTTHRNAVRKHVEVVVIPLAGRGERRTRI